MRTVSFKTRARTVDHLGREQIADVPTAISELWKNSYDAYARSVSLTLFDEAPLVVTIADDGHGMSFEELVDRWLVVGTESKLFEDVRSEKDRDGLPPRTRQGQKGIGRLSSAQIGSLLLLVTKRRDEKMAAVMIDWRLFENPFLILTDIEVPVVDFDEPQELSDYIPLMADALLENIVGNARDDERSRRIKSAWSNYDYAATKDADNAFREAPSKGIISSCNSVRFEERHLESWGVWTGASARGTAMVVFNANDELVALLPANTRLATLAEDRKRFIGTLGSFVDPLYDPARPEVNAVEIDFEYGVFTSSDGKVEKIIGSDKEYNRSLTDSMEHILDGRIDEKGIFRGQVKSFGEWRKLGSEYEIRPPKELEIPTGSGTFLGPIDFYCATFELEERSSSHTPQHFGYLRQHALEHAGLMIYRNGLRVLPYGRADNDFFEIEARRNKHAGREFWNSKRIFGRLAISRERNPNLRDKAGREGFIVNKAAKTLKQLITHILMTAARDYYGTAAEDRKDILAKNQANFEEVKAKEAQSKLRQKHRKEFRKNLQVRNATIPSVVQRLQNDISITRIETPADIPIAQERLELIQANIAELRLPGAPAPLGTLEDDYRLYRQSIKELNQLLSDFSSQIALAAEKINPPSPQEIIQKQIQRNEGQLTSRISRWAREIRALQDSEQERIGELVGERNKLFREEAKPYIERTALGRLSLNAASKAILDIKNRLDAENEILFQNYIYALESLRDNIDIQSAAILSGNEGSELRSQVDRLNGLAQLGITVEFLDHELHSHDAVINESIKGLRSTLGHNNLLQQLATGYSGLKQILDFLGPLRMAGRPQPRKISGDYIYDYIIGFFNQSISTSGIEIIATDAFKRFSVYEQPSRLLPVFINLVNNSIYWLINTRSAKPIIILEAKEKEVIVADNGPGIDEIDIKRLFTLFFSRKADGGRGVGLYLSQANLAAGGHSIRYEQEESKKILPGANFSLTFRGATFDD